MRNHNVVLHRKVKRSVGQNLRRPITVLLKDTSAVGGFFFLLQTTFSKLKSKTSRINVAAKNKLIAKRLSTLTGYACRRVCVP